MQAHRAKLEGPFFLRPFFGILLLLISSRTKKGEHRGKEMSRCNYDEYKRWWNSNMDTHHVTLRQRIHTKRYKKMEPQESTKQNTRVNNQLPRPTIWTQDTRWLTTLIRSQRTWTSERRKALIEWFPIADGKYKNTTDTRIERADAGCDSSLITFQGSCVVIQSTHRENLP